MNTSFTCPACKYVNEVDQPPDIEPVLVQPCAMCHIWVHVATGAPYTPPKVHESPIIPSKLESYEMLDVPSAGLNGRTVFRIAPPIVLTDGSRTSYVVVSYGLESVLGEHEVINVFPASAAGDIMEWIGLYGEEDSPKWAAELVAVEQGSEPNNSNIYGP